MMKDTYRDDSNNIEIFKKCLNVWDVVFNVYLSNICITWIL